MHPADGSITSWYDDDERANLIAGCPFILLSKTWNDLMFEKLRNSSGDSEYQMVRYVQLPSLLTPIARALLSALTVSDTADPSGPCSAHVLSLFAARNATIDGPSNERWDSESPVQ